MCYGFQMNSNVPFTEVGASLWEIILARGYTKSFVHIISSLLRPSITFWIFRNSRQPAWQPPRFSSVWNASRNVCWRVSCFKGPYFHFFIPSPCTPVHQGHTSNYAQTLWTSKKKIKQVAAVALCLQPPVNTDALLDLPQIWKETQK